MVNLDIICVGIFKECDYSESGSDVLMSLVTITTNCSL